jgi:hypothetical protein
MPKQALALINKKLELPIGESSEFNFFWTNAPLVVPTSKNYSTTYQVKFDKQRSFLVMWVSKAFKNNYSTNSNISNVLGQQWFKHLYFHYYTSVFHT